MDSLNELFLPLFPELAILPICSEHEVFMSDESKHHHTPHPNLSKAAIKVKDEKQLKQSAKSTEPRMKYVERNAKDLPIQITKFKGYPRHVVSFRDSRVPGLDSGAKETNLTLSFPSSKSTFSQPFGRDR